MAYDALDALHGLGTVTTQAVDDFLERHSGRKLGAHMVATAVVGIPVLHEQNGQIVNIPIMGAGKNELLNSLVGNSVATGIRPRGLATVSTNVIGNTVIHLEPAPNAKMVWEGREVAVRTLGRPTGDVNDFGIPLKDRDPDEQYVALAAIGNTVTRTGSLVGVTSEGDTVPLPDMGNYRSFASVAMPILKVGVARGHTVAPELDLLPRLDALVNAHSSS